MAQSIECPDCRSSMEEGFIPDFTQHGALQMLWHPRTPEDQKFLGLKMGTVKVDRSEAIKITVFRCSRCGLLKPYAREESEF